MARPLTAKQGEALQIVGECKGNIAEAARRTGCDRKTMEQHYKTGMAKLGKSAVKHRTKRMPVDLRGQEHVGDGEDRRRG